MLRFTRIIVRRFWGLTAFLLISLAVVVTLGRELAPSLSKYKPEIEAYFSELMGVQVEISSFEAKWEGLSPELRMRGLYFKNPEGVTLLEVNTAIAELSLLRSLLNWQLAWGNLEFVQLDIALQQQDNLSWALVGWKPPENPGQFNYNDPLDIFLLGQHIRLRDTRFSFLFRTGHTSEVFFPSLLMENQGDFHRFTSNVSVDRNTDVLTMIIEGNGDPRDIQNFTAKGYLRLQEFELERALAALPGQLWEGLPNQEWRKGHDLNLEAWFEIHQGMDIKTHGRVDVGDIAGAIQQDVPFPEQSGTNFFGQWAANGAWSISLRDILLDWGDVQAPPLDVVISSPNLGEAVSVQLADFQIDQWLATLNQANAIPKNIQSTVDTLKPSGALKNIRFVIEGTDVNAVRVESELVGINANAWRGAPAVKNLNGYLQATPFSGFVNIETEAESDPQLSVLFDTIYKKPFVLDSAKGQVAWKVDTDNKRVFVNSGYIAIDGEPGTGGGYFSLTLPFQWGAFQEELIIQLGLKNAPVSNHALFVPFTAQESLLRWLDKSLSKGIVKEGGFIYRGGLRFATMAQTSLQFYADISDASLDYHPDWPALSAIDGTVWLDDATVIADVDSATYSNGTIDKAHGEFAINAKDNAADLTIAGQWSGKADKGMDFLRSTPLHEIIGEQILSWDVSGDLIADAQLTIPISLGGESSQQPEVTEDDAMRSTPSEVVSNKNDESEVDFGSHEINFSVKKGHLTIPSANIQVADIAGKARYTNTEGLTASRLTGKFLGHPASAAIRREVVGDNSADLIIDIEGTNSPQAIATWLQQPLLHFLDGEAPYTAQFIVPYEKSRSDQTKLTITSKLEGVAIHLPEPLVKHANEPREIRVTVTEFNSSPLFRFNMAEGIVGELQIDDGSVEWIRVGVNDEMPVAKKGDLGIAAVVDYVAWKPWFATYEQWQKFETEFSRGTNDKGAANRAPLTPVVAVKTKQFAYDDFFIEDVTLNAQRLPVGWSAIVTSDNVAGSIQMFDDTAVPWVVNLERFHWQDPEQVPAHPFMPPPPKVKADPLANWDPADIPAMDIRVGSLNINGDDLGQWRGQIQPVDKGIYISNLFADMGAGKIRGSEESVGAKAWWLIGDTGMETRFQGRFVSNDLAAVLKQWDQPALVESNDALFDASLMWAGSPANLSTLMLNGDLTVSLNRGAFNQQEGDAGGGAGGMLQLLSFFNFDTWVRRLRLDFSDITSSGFAFDALQGSISFDQGVVQVPEPLIVETASGKFQINGRVNLIESSVDALLVATLPVGGNLTLFTAVAAGLPAALGVYVVSKVFEKQMNKVASVRYQITGPLEDPNYKFDKLFDDQLEVIEIEKVSQTQDTETSS